MRFQKITIGQLEHFVQSGDYSAFGPLPITPLRALSQVKNPKASPDDVVLTLAVSDDEELIGYIGALPERIGDVRCAWNSGWWVKDGSPAEVSMKLLFSFLNDWNRKILFSEMTPHTSLLIEKLKFCSHQTIFGLRGYSRFCLSEVLVRKKPSLKRFGILFNLADFFGNVLVDLFQLFLSKAYHRSEGMLVEEMDTLTEACDEFISRHNQKQPAHRYSRDFNWISGNHWVVQEPYADNTIGKRYFFSYAVKDFQLRWVKFTRNGEIVALVCYSIRDNKLKLPYVYAEDSAVAEVGDFFYSRLLSNKKVCSITTFHPGLAEYLSSGKQFLFKTRLPKLSAVSHVLLGQLALSDFEMQMGDGDCIFT